MFKTERQHEIYKILSETGFATVKQLSEKLYTSESSIRRDLSQMEDMAFIKRSYGGASIITAATNVLPFQSRSYSHIAEKKRIAEKALQLIGEGDILFLDQSTTSYFLALALMSFQSVTVVTNNIEILSLLSQTKLTVHASGGVVSPRNNTCLVGDNAKRAFEEIYADFAFFSARSISEDGIISDCTQEEIFVRNAMLKNAKRRVFLCDSSKMNSRSAYIQCDLSGVDIAITENDAFSVFCEKYPSVRLI